MSHTLTPPLFDEKLKRKEKKGKRRKGREKKTVE
jgi:hypothetical protein